MSSRATLEHVLACLETLYHVVGEGAPSLTNDAYVVRAYEMARNVGEVALDVRAHLEDPRVEQLAALADTLRAALDGDDSGALVLYAVAVLVGPRMLVTLADARAAREWNEVEHDLLNEASAVLIREILAIGEVAKYQVPVDDELWQERARALGDALDANGNAESFRLSH